MNKKALTLPLKFGFNTKCLKNVFLKHLNSQKLKISEFKCFKIEKLPEKSAKTLKNRIKLRVLGKF